MNASPANDIAPAAKAAKKIAVWEIRTPDRKRFGVARPGAVLPNRHAEIVVGVSIRLFGMTKPGNRYVIDASGARVLDPGTVYRRDFKVGDEAVYGSYNLVYTGTITAIGEKTVTITESGRGGQVHRLALYEFDWRNWNFDPAETARRNADTMRYI